MDIIENSLLKVITSAKGAELQSIVSKKTGLEYMWQAGKEWPKHAPVLFPIVGQLRENTFYHNNESYQLPRHGFARDSEFVIHKQSSGSISYLLGRSKPSAGYPFCFNFFVTYALSDNTLEILFKVENVDSDPIYFSIGGHPAFNVPLHPSENYSDYYLEFEKQETASRYMLDNGLLNGETKPVLNDSSVLPLKKELFYDDALVFKDLLSERISIKSKKSSNGLHFDFKGYDSFGIWAARDADFVCLEPWMGHADFITHNQQIRNKEGIIELQSGEVFGCSFDIQPF